MPVVPTTNGLSVGPRPLPQIRTSQEDFGGGQAAERPDFSGLGQAALNIYQAEKQKADQVATLDAGSKLSALETSLLYGENGALSQRGKNAFSQPEAVRTAWEKGIADIGGGLTNNEQRASFNQMVASHWTSVQSQVQRHVANERQQYDDQAISSYVGNEHARALAAFDNPNVVEQSIGNQVAAIKDHSARNGLPSETTKELTDKATSQTRLGVLTQFLDNGQDLNASKYLDAHRNDFVGPDLLQAERLTEAGSVRGEGQRQADQITDKAANLGDALKQVGQIQDVRIRDEADQRVRRFYADQATTQRQQRDQAFQSASSIIEQTGGDYDKVPIAQRMLLSPDENEQLQRRADELRHPKRYTDPDTYHNLMNMAGLPGSRDQFLRTNLMSYRDKLSDADYEKLTNLQLSGRLSIEKKDETTQQKADAQKSADDITGRTKSLEDGLAEVQKITDPKLRDATETRVRRFFTDANRKAAMQRADSVRKAKAAKDAQGRATLDSILGHPTTPSKAPGGPLTKPGGAPPIPLKPTAMGPSVPQEWVDHALTNDPEYADYLEHMGVNLG